MNTRILANVWRALVLVLVSGATPAVWASTSNEMPDLWAAFNEARHEIEPAGPDAHSAWNPGHRLQIRFAADAVQVAAGQAGSDWTWGVRLTGYGTPEAILPVAPAEVAASGRRLEYRRGLVTEWYENKPEGLEQGFTLMAPPQPDADTVVLSLAVAGGLQPRLEQAGQSVSFNKSDGTPALNYSELKVVDAKGATLPAHLALADGGLRIEVQARGAVWPVVVDPLVKSAVSKTSSGSLVVLGTDLFGQSAAISGDTAVVGSPQGGCLLSGSLLSGGHGYIYVRTLSGSPPAPTWSNQAGICDTALLGGDEFGYSVSVYGDTVVIGAPGRSSNTGRVWVFTRSGSTWTNRTSFAGNDSVAGDRFGEAVALYGNTLVVGAPGENNSQGSAYVFTGSAASWTQQAILTKASRVNNDRFGTSVALTIGATGHLMIGAPGVSSNAGAAYVYSGSTTTWVLDAGGTLSGAASGDLFGTSVALYRLADDPVTALVGAPNNDTGASTAGAAYVYGFSGSTWSLQATLTLSSPAAGDNFGTSLALSEGTALISAPGRSGGIFDPNAGAAYVFTHGTGNTWTQQDQYLKGDSGSSSDSDGFGTGVALTGNAAVVGNPRPSGIALTQGTANLYTLPCAYGRSYTTGQWMTISIPCVPNTATDSLGELFGQGNTGYAHFLTTNFRVGSAFAGDWTVWRRDPAQASNNNIQMTALTETVGPGTGYWLKSGTAPTGPSGGAIGTIPNTATASVASTLVYPAANSRCPSSNGCYVIPLAVSTNRFNMVGNAIPFDVDWADVVVDDGSTARTPSAAQAAGLMSATAWIWNGSAYQTFDDSATPGTLRVMRSFFVKVLTNSGTLQLLIPAKPTLKTSAVTPAAVELVPSSELPWYLGWLNWIVPPAAAEALEGEPVAGLRERELKLKTISKYLRAGKAWRVQLIAEIPAKHLNDPGNWLGLLPGSKLGFDITDLKELAPQAPYLTLVFPHPDWGANAGNYATDYHAPNARGKVENTWNFEVRADESQAGETLFLSWQGDPAVIRRCFVTDMSSGRKYRLNKLRNRAGISVPIAATAQSFTFTCQGNAGNAH